MKTHSICKFESITDLKRPKKRAWTEIDYSVREIGFCFLVPGHIFGLNNLALNY